MLTVRIHKVGAAIVFALLTAWLLIGSWQSPRPHSSVQQQHSAQKESTTGNHAVSEGANPEEALARYTWWLVVFTGILSVATIGLGVATVGLYLTGEKQIGVAKQSADAANLNAQAVIESERARLYAIIDLQTIENEVKRVVAPRHPPLADDIRLENLAIEYSFRNYGKTPAFILEIGHGTAVTENVPKGRRYVLLVPLPIEYVVGAGEKTARIRNVNIPSMTVGTARAIQSSDATFWFHGYVEYDDTFQWRRRFEFVWHYSGVSEGFRLFSYKETAQERERQKQGRDGGVREE
jgi:hypothetical protein